MKKPSPEKSMKQNSPSKVIKERTPRSERGESPDAKKIRSTPQTKTQSKVKMVVSPPKFLNEKAVASKNKNSSKGKKEESQSPPKMKKGKTPLSK